VRRGLGLADSGAALNSQQAEAVGGGVPVKMQAASLALLNLARRQRWAQTRKPPGVRVTQSAHAEALSEEDSAVPAAVLSWESLVSPKLPAGRR